MTHALIVSTARTPLCKSWKGAFNMTHGATLGGHAIRHAVQRAGVDPAEVEDVLMGCANPEGATGWNIARQAALAGGLPITVSGATINRFCSSGLQAVAMAADRIRLGEADVMIAAGTESMTIMPQMMGNKLSISPAVFERDENYAIAFGMGITAEKVAAQWKISREEQDAFAVESHRRAVAAIGAGKFAAEISPYTVRSYAPSPDGTVKITERLFDTDEGPRTDSTMEALAKLKPVFATKGSVTAGNSSQMSDGAAAVLLMSEAALKRYNATPIARFAAFSVAGVPPEIMGIGPVEAIPRALKQAGITQEQVDWIELNEAFAAQALAVVRELKLDPAKVNPQGGAIALGHPLGATGAIRAATLMNAMQREKFRYGMISMCIGTGMGAAGIFERV